MRRGDFTWNLAGNFSLNRNEVVSLAGASVYILPDSYVRIASLWAGELNGLSRAHQGYAQYIVSSQSFFWNPLYPVASQARLVQTKADAVND